MQQQQIKAQNTVQNSHAQQKNIVPSIVNTYRTSNNYCQAIFSPTLLQPNDKGTIITLESKHNRQQKQAAMRNFKNAKCNDGEDIGKVNVLKFNLEHIEKIHIFARCNPYLHT